MPLGLSSPVYLTKSAVRPGSQCNVLSIVSDATKVKNSKLGASEMTTFMIPILIKGGDAQTEI